MATLARVRVVWSGSPVTGPGVSTFYFNQAGSGWTASLNTFFTAVASKVPGGVTFTCSSTGDLVDAATGELSGTWTDGTSWTKVSSGTGVYARGVGTRVRWATNGIRNGRRVRGSTFLVPLVAACYDSDGSIDNTIRNTLTDAAIALVVDNEPDMVIYSRPQGGSPGFASQALNADLPDQVSWLRSRRT
jgi:hypothetical protein